MTPPDPMSRLSKGQAFGKSSILIYDAGKAQPITVPMLSIEGDSLNACQLMIMLAPPRRIPLPFDPDCAENMQNLTDEEVSADGTSGNFPGELVPIQGAPLKALVEWGVDGARTRAVVDYGDSVTLNVVASYLRVSAVVPQNEDLGEFTGISAAYYLAAFVSPGWSKDASAQRTICVGTLESNVESAVFDIPSFAKRVLHVGCATSSPPNSVGYIRFWQNPDSTNGVGDFFQSGSQAEPFDVPDAAQYFSVFNQSDVTMKFFVVFEIVI
jgi:hypothetical protein